MLRAALGFLQLAPRAPELRLLHRWLDTWRGVGVLAVGLHRVGYDLALIQHADEGWNATFFVTGRMHSIAGGWANAPTPWGAVQRAGWEAIQHAERTRRRSPARIGTSRRRPSCWRRSGSIGGGRARGADKGLDSGAAAARIPEHARPGDASRALRRRRTPTGTCSPIATRRRRRRPGSVPLVAACRMPTAAGRGAMLRPVVRLDPGSGSLAARGRTEAQPRATSRPFAPGTSPYRGGEPRRRRRTAVSVSGDDQRFKRVDGCELCRAARITRWFHEDEICWIAECEICETPMVVWRWHGTEPPDNHLRHMQERLREVAAERVGEFWVDDHMRNIPDHFHAHARPKGGFFGR